MTMVRNLNFTTGKRCPCCTSWIAHWYKNAKSDRQKCAVNGCSSAIQVGAHVKKAHGNASGHHYIVPMCQAHNGATDDLDIDDRVALVPATPCC